MIIDLDGKRVESTDILKLHGKDGGSWINAPELINMMELTPGQAAGFMALTWGLAQCTICNEVTIWTGPNRTVQD